MAYGVPPSLLLSRRGSQDYLESPYIFLGRFNAMFLNINLWFRDTPGPLYLWASCKDRWFSDNFVRPSRILHPGSIFCLFNNRARTYNINLSHCWCYFPSKQILFLPILVIPFVCCHKLNVVTESAFSVGCLTNAFLWLLARLPWRFKAFGPRISFVQNRRELRAPVTSCVGDVSCMNVHCMDVHTRKRQRNCCNCARYILHVLK